MRPASSTVFVALALCCLAGCAETPKPSAEIAPAPAETSVPQATTRTPAKPSSSQTGTATYYSRSLTNRKMADGSRFDPKSDSAASKTLPLGSKAQVTNLSNGKSATVTIRDRGPYAKGAIIDVSPSVAASLNMTQKGRARVKVTPMPEETITTVER